MLSSTPKWDILMKKPAQLHRCWKGDWSFTDKLRAGLASNRLSRGACRAWRFRHVLLIKKMRHWAYLTLSITWHQAYVTAVNQPFEPAGAIASSNDGNVESGIRLHQSTSRLWFAMFKMRLGWYAGVSHHLQRSWALLQSSCAASDIHDAHICLF